MTLWPSEIYVYSAILLLALCSVCLLYTSRCV